MSRAGGGLRLVVLGTVASDPWAGMAWMHLQIAAGLLALGHDVYYVEATSAWPYDPLRLARVRDGRYAVDYLSRVAIAFGLGHRWAYRRSYADREWLGPARRQATAILASADAVINVSGSTRLREEELEVRRLVYLGTDPVFHEVRYAQGDPDVRSLIDEHDLIATYGENIGTERCPLPPLPGLRARTRQPVLLDRWRALAPGERYTTVTNWRQRGREVEFAGRRYEWSKHFEFERFIELPSRLGCPVELATNLRDAAGMGPGRGEQVPALGLPHSDRERLAAHGWGLADATALSADPFSYRDYVAGSRAELSIARELNVALRSGWFSERSACYLAAGRPVVAQDTGFGDVLPTGEGLFAFNTTEQAVAAFAELESDYERHSRAARELAREHFAADRVLPRLLDDLGL